MDSLGPNWKNWVGNERFTPLSRLKVATEDDAIEAVRACARAGRGLRTFGAGHSFTPIVETAGTLLDTSALRGIISVDTARCLVTAWAQTPIAELSEALWQHGLALANQGDIDAQAIAGAIATGTHGSGIKLGSFSSTLEGARLIDGTGEIHQIGPDDPRIEAVRTSIGLLGLMTRVTLKAVPAYFLHEQIRVMHVHEVLDRWEELLASYRHFSFFWMPTDESAGLYGFPPAPQDHCMVKLYKDVPRLTAVPQGDRLDRSYRIYPHVFEPNFHELEYFVPAQAAKEAFAAQRAFMIKSLPDSRFPLEVRFVRRDEAWMSPNYQRDSLVLSISGTPGTNYWPYLRAADAVLAEFDARPHWGKLHFMTPARLAAAFPRYQDFMSLRRSMDPAGMFLNPHLAAMFA